MIQDSSTFDKIVRVESFQAWQICNDMQDLSDLIRIGFNRYFEGQGARVRTVRLFQIGS